MTAPTPITSGMRLTPARLNRPAWQNLAGTIWTASSSNPSIGDGVVSCRWRYIDAEQVEVRYIIRPGSTTTFGSGQYRLALPVPAAAGGPDPQLAAVALHGGSLYRYLGWSNTSAASASFLSMYRANINSAENLASWTPTSPVTFANGHTFSMSGFYFVA